MNTMFAIGVGRLSEALGRRGLDTTLCTSEFPNHAILVDRGPRGAPQHKILLVTQKHVT